MRKFICLALALLMLLSLISVAFAAEEAVLGDVSDDGVVNNVDAMIILQATVGLKDPLDPAIADVSGDGVVNNVDAMIVLQYSVGLVTKFPAEKEEEIPVVEIYDISEPVTVEVAAGKKVNVTGRIFGVTMTIENAADASVTFNDTTYTADADGVLTVEFPEASMGFMTPPVEFLLANSGKADASYELSFEYPVGSYMNPEVIWNLSQINVAIEEGNDEGYYYSYYNRAVTGTISLSVASATAGVEYDVILINQNSYESSYLSDSQDGTVSVDVVPNDYVLIQVAVYPDNDWNYPAADIQLKGEIIYPAGSQMNPAALNIGANSAKLDAGTQGYFYTWIATGTGDLTITMDASNASGWNFNLYNLNTYSMTDIMTTQDGNTATLAVNAGDEVQVTVNTFDVNDPYNPPAGTVSFQASFAAADSGSEGGDEGGSEGGDEGGSQGGSTVKEEKVVSETKLALGSNSLTLDASAVTTVYEFKPDETGVYTFTVPSGSVVGYWGASEWFLSNPNSTATSCQWDCTGVGQSAYIGVSGASKFTLTVEKSGESGGDGSSTYIDYQNVHTPEVFTGALTNKKSVDITKSHTAVLGSDGYYHLDSADGARLYVNMKDSTWNFVLNTKAAFTLRGIVYDGNGNATSYEFLTAMQAYADAVGATGYYPLTEDLITFMKGYGNAQGWWMESLSPFASIQNGNANEDSMWMVLCVTAD